MKAFLLLLLPLCWQINAMAQDTLQQQESITICWTNDLEPQPLNLDSVTMLIHHPSICVEGKLIVRILLDANGKYVKHIVLKTPHQLCTEAVEPFLQYIRFVPATMGGKAVKSWVTIPFKFGTQKGSN
jgi:periplasmic protein TonB